MVRTPRASDRVLQWLRAGYGQDHRFSRIKRPYRSYWDRRLNALVTADLTEWGGRYAYYWGRYYDVTHQAVLRHFLKPGDTYIDVGANLGFHSLCASGCVGRSGLVLSFEPHPATFRILNAHIAMNRLSQCRTFNMALSDAPGQATLNQLETHSGSATLLNTKEPICRIPVELTRGDAILAGIDLPGDIVVKIDVEGHEFSALRGLEQTLSRINVACIEVTPRWLALQGACASELYRKMSVLGFEPFVPKLHWVLKMFAPALRFNVGGEPPPSQHDVVFVRSGSRQHTSIERLLVHNP